MKMLFFAVILLLPPAAFAGLSEWATDVSINDDRSVDWTITFRHNESVSRSDYFILSRAENVQVLADDIPVQCSVTENVGTTILCSDIHAGRIVYKFRTANAASVLRSLLIFSHRFSVTQLTGRFSVTVRLPLGAVLVEKPRLEGTGLARFEPSWGREGSDGRRIFVEWISTEPKLGETYDMSLVYEQAVSGEKPILPVVLVVAAAIAIAYFAFARKPTLKDMLPVLTESERKVMEILIREKGSVDQRKLVKDLDYSKPKISRIMKNLSDRGLVEKVRKGRTNIIMLRKAGKIQETSPKTSKAE